LVKERIKEFGNPRFLANMMNSCIFCRFYSRRSSRFGLSRLAHHGGIRKSYLPERFQELRLVQLFAVLDSKGNLSPCDISGCGIMIYPR